MAKRKGFTKHRYFTKDKMHELVEQAIDGDQTALKLSVDNHNNKNVPLHLKYMAGNKVYFEIKFTLFANENDEYVVPLSWIYSWYLQKGKRLIISTKKISEIQINNVSIIKMTD